MLSTTNEKHSLPARYEHVEYEDVPSEIRDLLSKMLADRKGLYLYGDCGVGKTHIAYAIWARCKEKSIAARIYKSTEMLDVIRDFYGKSHYDYSDNELRKLMDYTGVLIIDDIGVEKATEWVAETLTKIIDRRYEERLPTIFTSNLSLDQLAEKIGDRVPSRIAEMCHVEKLEGDDRRIA